MVEVVEDLAGASEGPTVRGIASQSPEKGLNSHSQRSVLDARRRSVFDLREAGKSYREIGEALGISRGFAQALNAEAVRRLYSGNVFRALSVRARNCLASEGFKTKVEVICAIENGSLTPKRTPGYGPKTHGEILEWIGIEEKE